MAGNVFAYPATPVSVTLAADSTAGTVVAAPGAGLCTQVLSCVLTSTAATKIQFTNGGSTGATGAAASIPFYIPANASVVLNFNPVGWFYASGNVILAANTSGVAVNVQITYATPGT